MTRKAFADDLVAAANRHPAAVSDVRPGSEEGEVIFEYSVPGGLLAPVEIQITATDKSGYPAESTFFLCTTSDDSPTLISEALRGLQDFAAGSTIQELIASIDDLLTSIFAAGTRETPIELDEDDVDFDAVFKDQAHWSDDDDGYIKHASNRQYFGLDRVGPRENRIKSDLRAVYDSGFKVAVLEGAEANSSNTIISMSIKVNELGLSEEAIDAWDLVADHYLVLLVRYQDGYRTLQEVAESRSGLRQHIDFKIGVYKGPLVYKPDLLEAISAFASEDEYVPKKKIKADSNFQSMFISSSLDEFMNGHFLSILKIRWMKGLDWEGAIKYLQDKAFQHGENAYLRTDYDDEYYVPPEPSNMNLAEFMRSDHFVEDDDDTLSLPLVAMQFALRFVVRCTEFCLVCHNRTPNNFEVLKPYVCSNPLCLYQYLSLGFGPNIEHEILTQPYVIDLLISFCYVAAKCHRFRDYPDGLTLMVPGFHEAEIAQSIGSTDFKQHLNHSVAAVPAQQPLPNHTASSSANVGEIPPGSSPKSTANAVVGHHFPSESTFVIEGPAVRIGKNDWVTLKAGQDTDYHDRHYRVLRYTHPDVLLETNSIETRASDSLVPIQSETERDLKELAKTRIQGVLAKLKQPSDSNYSSRGVPGELVLWTCNFDEFTREEKCRTMTFLLDLLPSVKEMVNYLRDISSAKPTLKSWVQRIPPASIGLLRWIVASNRSCIVQVDRCPGQTDKEVEKLRSDQGIKGLGRPMLQFRFAQGAPDKEKAFREAVVANAATKQQPTIFAFHGSHLMNWHSIIRQGLDFAETLSGRAFGNGVYHSLDLITSITYASNAGIMAWPGSALKITSAICLNEIVNAPEKFTSCTPHIVVQEVKWIQCRYLLVTSASVEAKNTFGEASTKLGRHTVPEILQDVKFNPRGSTYVPLSIPLSAFPTSRGLVPKLALDPALTNTSYQKLRGSASDNNNSQQAIFKDRMSAQDLQFLVALDHSALDRKVKGKEKAFDFKKLLRGSSKRQASCDVVSPAQVLSYIYDPNKTDYIPGSLVASSLPMLQEPTYATSQASRTLARALKDMLKVQATTPQHELGWYMDGNLVTNVYQWILEMHSFDPALPLAQDLKTAKMTSIVFELRFPADFPMSPPFVRVIRPRFLPFMHGGGGHVTGGGAMCMELLTNTGWTPASAIDVILVQIKLALGNLEPRPARIIDALPADYRRSLGVTSGDYGTAEAMEAYVRATRAHGWEVPKNFQKFKEAVRAAPAI